MGPRIEVVRDGNMSDSSGSIDVDVTDSPSKKSDPSAIREIDTLHAKRGLVYSQFQKSYRPNIVEYIVYLNIREIDNVSLDSCDGRSVHIF